MAEPGYENEVAAQPLRAEKQVRNALEWIAIVAGALLAAFLVKTFLIQAFFIPSLSMYPTLDKGDRVLVNKVSYRVHDVHRGDIVVFERPPNAGAEGIKDLIKRVIGLPGDFIEAKEGIVYINDRALNEPYIDEGDETENLQRTRIQPHHVFVMGDNRDDSEDSRVFGAIDEDLIIGRAFVRIWPVFRFSLL